MKVRIDEDDDMICVRCAEIKKGGRDPGARPLHVA